MDFIIVGGGIYGCLVAWRLAQRGGEVLLLEADRIASGASGGPGKRGVRANGRDLRELPLMEAAYRIWPTLHEEIDAPTGYERCGHLQLIERERDLSEATARAWMQTQQGIPTEMLDAHSTRELEPHLSGSVRAALHCPLDGVADHTATTVGVAAAAQRSGAVVREQVKITAIVRSGANVTEVVSQEGKRFAVRKALMLLANGALQSYLQREFSLTLPIWQRLPQVLFTEAVEPMPVRHLIGHAHRRLAMKAGPDQSVMISGGWLGRAAGDGSRGQVQPDQVAGNLAEAVAVYPVLDGVAVANASADRLESDCVDHIPIIDRVPGLENAYYGVGWSGHGWAVSPAVGQLLADWVMDDQRPSLLAPFGSGRFRRGRVLT